MTKKLSHYGLYLMNTIKFIEELNLENNFKYFNTFKEESIYFENIIPSAKQSKFSMMGIFTGLILPILKLTIKKFFSLIIKEKNEI